MAAVGVMRVLVLLFCLSMLVEVESKVLHEEQSLTEIIDYDTQDTGVNLHPTTKKENTKNVPSVLERKNSSPRNSRREQFSVEMVDESTQTKKIFSSENVKGNDTRSLGFLSKEEAALVDQDVDNVLDFYGFREKNDPKKENKEGFRIREPNAKIRESTMGKNRVLNSVKKSNQALKDLNKNQKLPDKAEKPVFKFQTKKMPDPKLAKMMNQNNSPNARTNSKQGHKLQEQKNKFDFLQQKNIIHYSPLQKNNGNLLTLKNNFVKDISAKNGYQSNWLPVRDNIKLFQDDKSQDSEPKMPANVAKATQEYMKMPSKEILELVQNDTQVPQQNGSLGAQGKNGSKGSRGRVDIAAPNWLPIKEKIHGIEFDMTQDDENKMAPYEIQGIQSDMPQTQKNGRQSQVSGVQNNMAQKNGNSKIQNDLSGKQKNDWLPVRLNIQGLKFNMSRDERNSSNKTKMKMGVKNIDSLTEDSMEVGGLNATVNSEFENITRDHNGTNTAKNLEDSVRNDALQYGNITFKSTKQNGSLSNNSDIENIHSSEQDKLNFTSLPNENSKSSFRKLKNEKDVTQQVWSPGKVINSHGHEILHMTSWGPWSTCSDTCGNNGLQIRTRHCTQNDDLHCNGSTIDWKWCASVDICPESGLHVVSHNNNSTYADVVIEENTLPNQWGSWSACSKRCGTKSLRIRNRNCPGQRSKDTGVCVEPTMQWTWCKSVACGGPQHATTMSFGYNKQGMPSVSKTIPADKVKKASNPVIHTDNGITFKDNCTVSSWSKWSKCSKSCGENSFKFRTRICNCNYKQLCKSSTLQREHCKLQPCEGEENYGPWTPFSTCTKSCGGGWKKRTRRCKEVKGRHLCDQDLLIGVKVCNTHKCGEKASNGVYKDAMVANVNPNSMCGFNPCTEFSCMDNPDTKCLADTSCDPVFFNEFGQIDEKCRGWQRYEVKNPTLFCGFDPCFGSKCQRAFGRCLVDLNCKAFVLGADGTQIACNMIQFPF